CRDAPANPGPHHGRRGGRFSHGRQSGEAERFSRPAPAPAGPRPRRGPRPDSKRIPALTPPQKGAGRLALVPASGAKIPTVAPPWRKTLIPQVLIPWQLGALKQCHVAGFPSVLRGIQTRRPLLTWEGRFPTLAANVDAGMAPFIACKERRFAVITKL